IYALGIIGYEALVGHRPFTGKTMVDIAFAHVNQQVPPMPEHIDSRVRRIIMSMLAKDPEDRPRSAASLARIIEELLPHLETPRPYDRDETSHRSSTEHVIDENGNYVVVTRKDLHREPQPRTAALP